MQKNNKGFTTVEVIIVAGLLSLVTGSFMSKQAKLEKEIKEHEEQLISCVDTLEECVEEREALEKFLIIQEYNKRKR